MNKTEELVIELNHKINCVILALAEYGLITEETGVELVRGTYGVELVRGNHGGENNDTE